jgi:hypothetical protein
MGYVQFVSLYHNSVGRTSWCFFGGCRLRRFDVSVTPEPFSLPLFFHLLLNFQYILTHTSSSIDSLVATPTVATMNIPESVYNLRSRSHSPVGSTSFPVPCPLLLWSFLSLRQPPRVHHIQSRRQCLRLHPRLKNCIWGIEIDGRWVVMAVRGLVWGVRLTGEQGRNRGGRESSMRG